MSNPVFLRLSDLCGRRNPPQKGMLPFSANTIWRKVRNGTFPKPMKLGPNVTAWLFADVQAWVDECVAAAALGDAQ
ncbi:helix-turn-helix transcriptional regulator [Roseateles sp. P5_E4]